MGGGSQHRDRKGQEPLPTRVRTRGDKAGIPPNSRGRDAVPPMTPNRRFPARWQPKAKEKRDSGRSPGPARKSPVWEARWLAPTTQP